MVNGAYVRVAKRKPFFALVRVFRLLLTFLL